MNTMDKITNFAKKAIAMVKGDQDEKIALYNEVKADSAINKNLANLKAKLVDDELNVKDAKDALEEAKYSPGVKISSLDIYTNNILAKRKTLEEAEDKVEDTKASIKYFEDLKEEMFK